MFPLNVKAFEHAWLIMFAFPWHLLPLFLLHYFPCILGMWWCGWASTGEVCVRQLATSRGSSHHCSVGWRHQVRIDKYLTFHPQQGHLKMSNVNWTFNKIMFSVDLHNAVKSSVAECVPPFCQKGSRNEHIWGILSVGSNKNHHQCRVISPTHWSLISLFPIEDEIKWPCAIYKIYTVSVLLSVICGTAFQFCSRRTAWCPKALRQALDSSSHQSHLPLWQGAEGLGERCPGNHWTVRHNTQLQYYRCLYNWCHIIVKKT